MIPNKIVDGKIVYLTDNEVLELEQFSLIYQAENKFFLGKEAKQKALPNNQQVLNALLSQFLYWRQNNTLDITDEMHDILLQLDKAMYKFKDVELEHDVKAPSVTFPQTDGVQTKISELEKNMQEMYNIAVKAQTSNTEIKDVISEINSALTAIKGFMMLLPEMQKILIELNNNFNDTESSNMNTKS